MTRRVRPDQAALVLALFSLGALVAAGLGAQAGFWHFRTGFDLLRWSAYGGLASCALVLLARQASRAALAAAILGLSAAAVPWNARRAARGYPAIHDISTDLENPPAFLAVLPLRQGSPNPPEHGGAELAAAQRLAYPDLAPLTLELPPGEAFARALAAAKKLGWKIAAAEELSGRIEATDTTFWFGFKDDVVIRVAGGPGGSRVDVRSVSRVGKGDVGTNARRIRRYLNALKND